LKINFYPSAGKVTQSEGSC